MEVCVAVGVRVCVGLGERERLGVAVRVGEAVGGVRVGEGGVCVCVGVWESVVLHVKLTVWSSVTDRVTSAVVVGVGVGVGVGGVGVSRGVGDGVWVRVHVDHVRDNDGVGVRNDLVPESVRLRVGRVAVELGEWDCVAVPVSVGPGEGVADGDQEGLWLGGDAVLEWLGVTDEVGLVKEGVAGEQERLVGVVVKEGVALRAEPDCVGVGVREV